ncbi:hypothetical protein SMS_02217 [Enterococcus faecium EnGen0184]|nr:hypothetical protein SMS_02217 [Enterococcus faecium EnGen0184]
MAFLLLHNYTDFIIVYQYFCMETIKNMLKKNKNDTNKVLNAFLLLILKTTIHAKANGKRAESIPFLVTPNIPFINAMAIWTINIFLY